MQTWSYGDPIPPEGIRFLFEDRVYFWLPCNCDESCQRPIAYREDFNIDLRTTGYLRGDDQGSAISDFLVLWLGMEDYTQAELTGDIINIWMETHALIEPKEDIRRDLLADKNIQLVDFVLACEEFDELSNEVEQDSNALRAVLNELSKLRGNPRLN